MTTKNYRIVMMTCDKYVNAIYPYAFLLKKYWPTHPEVVVLGFSPPSKPMPERFKFISVGKMEDFPVERWSDQLIVGLNMIPDEVFILTLEDMWLIRHVPEKVVDMAYDYMEQFKYVARLDLTGDRLNAGGAALYGELGYVKLIWSDPNSQYHLSMMPAFWRKEHLLRVLVPAETPWQVELDGTPRLSALRDEVIVLGTDAWPIRNTLAFRGGDINDMLLDEIAEDDVGQMKKLGLFEGLGK